MKKGLTLALATGVLAMLGTTVTLIGTRPEARSVGPVQYDEKTNFSREKSTGLFVGVRLFRHDQRLVVPYATDDAVDLAHRFAIDQRVALIPPRNVTIVLSGKPQKEESNERLRELRDAGADIVTNATAGDILHLAEEQASRAGRAGLFIFSLATHGFQRDGEAYILGSTSTFDSPDSSLRLSKLLDIAARPERSLVFVDACRERIGRNTRGGSSDPSVAAPQIRRMNDVHGQVIFYAAAPGQYAYDDDVHRNGVFTKAVLDGLNCGASAPRGTVVVETLHTFVERAVLRWIRENRDRDVTRATQISMEGRSKNMTLSECWRSPEPRIHVSVRGTEISVYDANTRPLWHGSMDEEIVHAEAADLDADSMHEVIVGLRNRIIVFNRDGKELWSKAGDAMSLRTFTTGDLTEKKTNQILAIWSGAGSSRLTIFDNDGSERPGYEHDGKLLHVAIGRPTNMHAPKIVVTTATSISILHAKKLKTIWQRQLASTSDAIDDLRIIDSNNDSRRDIEVSTLRGMSALTFEGEILRSDAAWREWPRKRGKARR